MPAFRIEIRGARDARGHVIHIVAACVEADDWFGARMAIHRRHGVDPYDPAMIVTPWTPADAAREANRILEEHAAEEMVRFGRASGAKLRRLTKAKRGKRIRA